MVEERRHKIVHDSVLVICWNEQLGHTHLMEGKAIRWTNWSRFFVPCNRCIIINNYVIMHADWPHIWQKMSNKLDTYILHASGKLPWYRSRSPTWSRQFWIIKYTEALDGLTLQTGISTYWTEGYLHFNIYSLTSGLCDVFVQ